MSSVPCEVLGVSKIHVAMLAIAAVAVGGCGGATRSTAAFCSTMKSEQHQILSQFNATAGGGGQGLAHAFDELGASVQAISALRTYFDELADVAPPEIEDQAKIVAQSYNQELSDMSGSAGHPFSAFFGAMMDSAASSSQVNDMNQFALRNCGHSI